MRGKVGVAFDGLWWVFWLCAAAVSTSILTIDGLSYNQTRASCAFCWISWCGRGRSGGSGAARRGGLEAAGQCRAAACGVLVTCSAAAPRPAFPPSCTHPCAHFCVRPPPCRRVLWTLSLVISIREMQGFEY